MSRLKSYILYFLILCLGKSCFYIRYILIQAGFSWKNGLTQRMHFVDLVHGYHEKNGSEVVKMMQLDYTFERQLELEREESYTKGRAEGREEGFEEGQQILVDVLMRLQKGETAEELTVIVV